ncbi:hypothetical protein M407DRAFT_241317 [Tulasnella calospora MUT 4182]|uniref:Uncharacterized protein n=1 Tax=Tulasnella calospora MUT 4182 TaxID=1051891 RepID=A0A0C3QVE4_9AGAM|nr:hypothetical protein M407DRAFT_241317 [Tulasnella calospora MUT 4182]
MPSSSLQEDRFAKLDPDHLFTHTTFAAYSATRPRAALHVARSKCQSVVWCGVV